VHDIDCIGLVLAIQMASPLEEEKIPYKIVYYLSCFGSTNAKRVEKLEFT